MLDTQLGLVLAYLLPTVLVAWLLTQIFPTRPRATLIVLLILPLFYIGHYLLIERLQGWPSESRLPDSFRLISYEAVEPNKRTGDPGRIFIWLQTDGDPDPRVHVVDYDPELHRRLGEAAAQQFAGKPQRGEVRPADENGSSESPGGDGPPRLFFRDDSRRLLPPKA